MTVPSGSAGCVLGVCDPAAAGDSVGVVLVVSVADSSLPQPAVNARMMTNDPAMKR